MAYIDQCRTYRDAWMMRAREALTNKEHIYAAIATREARDWHRSLMRYRRKAAALRASQEQS